jgi:hypothetical protein
VVKNKCKLVKIQNLTFLNPYYNNDITVFWGISNDITVADWNWLDTLYGWQDIGNKFTNQYLRRFIDHAPGNVVTVALEYTDNNACFYVTMKMAKGRAKNAIIATGW